MSAWADLEPIGTEGQEVDPERVSRLEKLESGLMSLVDIVEEGGKKKLAKLERAWKHFDAGLLADAKKSGYEVAARIAAILPPKLSSAQRSEHLDVWSEALETAFVHLEEEMSPVRAVRRLEREKEDRARIEEAIARLRAELSAFKRGKAAVT